jgi:hypothetical protein
MVNPDESVRWGAAGIVYALWRYSLLCENEDGTEKHEEKIIMQSDKEQSQEENN